MIGFKGAMKNTVWLLDVDGVLNATRAGWSAQPKSGWAYANGNSWRMRWSPQLIERIRKIHRTAHVEILWATTWVGYTSQLENLFKLPALLSAGSTGMGWGEKLAAAEAVLASGNRLIWTDDEAIPREWESSKNQLIIRPRSNRGLRPEHLDTIEKFVMR
jgi:hypothetical protein